MENVKGLTTPAECATDLDYAIRFLTTGRGDAGFAARIGVESARITQQIYDRHGLLDIAVCLVREARDDR